MCLSSSSSSAISSEQLDEEEEGEFYDFSSSAEDEDLEAEDSEEVSRLIADTSDEEDLSPEQLAAEDEEGEGRFGCMMTSGNADSGRIWSMLIYGLPVVVALYFRRRRKA